MADLKRVAQKIHVMLCDSFHHEFGKPAVKSRDNSDWQKLFELGTRLWLDTGDIEQAGRLWTNQFHALTTNNTLLNKEVQKGIYDELIKTSAATLREIAPDMDEQTLILEIAFVLNAWHGLRLVEQFDANVSVELHTDLGNDIERTVAYGKRFYDICPERFYVKVPFTPAGLLGARKLTQAGIPINFTLGFSARQNYLAALLTNPAYVNVFMGRLNAFVADNKLGDGQHVGEKATLATQRELIKLREQGRTNSLLIGASMRNAEQVAALAGLDVYTMPTKVAADYTENPCETLSSQIKQNPEVLFAEGLSEDDCYASSLWFIPEIFKDSVEELLEKDIDEMTAEDLQEHFDQSGLADILPQWSQEDIEMVTKDGKIPVYDKWKDRLMSHEIGLDALMNISAFCSFATDQKALDGRIQSLL